MNERTRGKFSLILVIHSILFILSIFIFILFYFIARYSLTLQQSSLFLLGRIIPKVISSPDKAFFDGSLRHPWGFWG